MLRSLSVRNIVLIDRLDLEFAPGLTALTGETGAGKSIILDALGLAAGARGDKALVRAGADQGSAAAAFAAAAGHPALAALDEAGLEPDAEGGEILLRRALSADGRSRAFVNDQATSVGLLGAVGETLIEVHGQHDGRGLLDARTHRGLLDAAGGHAGAVRAVRDAYDAMTAARETRDAAIAAHEAAEADREFLRHAVEELERLDPRPDEEEALARERAFLSAAEKSLTDLQDAAGALEGDSGLEDRLSAALASLERVIAKLPPSGEGEAESGPRAAIARAASALERALIEAGEAQSAVADAARRFEVEPGRLEKVEERLFALRGAARKHQTDVAALPELRRALTERLDGIEARGARLAEAEAALAKAEKTYDSAAAALTKARTKAAKALDAAVAAELAPLKLDKARFRTAVEPSGRDGPDGRDRVRFEVATNPGASFGPLDQIASGGELSRFGLAIKVALAGDAAGMTLIFDEVDQGVGGAVADAVGRRLKALSVTGQVLVVTHSPQVAARADHHFVIEKGETDGAVVTRVRELDAAGREEELARMLAGASVTEEARAAARKLRAADA